MVLEVVRLKGVGGWPVRLDEQMCHLHLPAPRLQAPASRSRAPTAVPSTACAGTPASSTSSSPPATTQQRLSRTCEAQASRCTACWATRRAPGGRRVARLDGQRQSRRMTSNVLLVGFVWLPSHSTRSTLPRLDAAPTNPSGPPSPSLPHLAPMQGWLDLPAGLGGGRRRCGHRLRAQHAPQPVLHPYWGCHQPGRRRLQPGGRPLPRRRPRRPPARVGAALGAAVCPDLGGGGARLK